MKKKLLLICSVLMTSLTFGQVIFSVESPAQIAGSYDLTFAPTTTWTSAPDLLDPVNAVLDTVAWAEDATAADSLNCMQTVSNVQGKVAVLYRGDCEFGTKALNAEAAGAVAVIIINNQPGGPVGMGAGTDGVTVTIPVIMIGDLDGVILAQAMESGDVEVFIGNKTGYYPNDVGVKEERVFRAKQYATPSAIAQNDTEFDVEPGAWVYNFGFNDQTTVKLSAVVELNGTELYNETSSPVDILAGDSTFIQLPVFNQTSYPVGEYELTYGVTSDSTDSYDADNTLDANFEITNDMISYAALDADGLPMNTGGFRPSTSTDFTACISIRNDNASRIGAEGMYFTAITGANSGAVLTGEPFNVQAFEWDDNFVDFNDANAGVTDISLVGFAEYTFEGDYQDSSVFAQFDQPFLLEDDRRYLFCVYNGNDDVFIGYDPSVNYTSNIEELYLQPQAPILTTDWFLAGFGVEETPALGIKTFPQEELGLDVVKEEINIVAYPSPASSDLKVAFFDNKVSNVTMMDMTGKVVKNINVNAGQKELKLNVSSLENGVYMVNVTLENGNAKVINVVVNH